MNKILQQGIKKAGGFRAVGRALGLSHQAVMKWEQVPAERVMEVEKLMGVPRSVLRPDIYPPEREKRRR